MALSLVWECNPLEKVIIIGGGVAGLSCLNELLALGHSPLLLEEKIIGTPKVCGEFLAPLAALQLQKWGIGPIQCIKEVNFIVNSKHAQVTFAQPAGAFSRRDAELGLAKRAYEQGGRILEQVSIKNITPPRDHLPYRIELDSGEQIQSQAVIIATGKLNPHPTPLLFPYQGFKIHVRQVIKAHTLFMSNYPGAYFGLVPISPGVSNLTCLARNTVVEGWGSCRGFFHHLVASSPWLRGINFSDMDWLEGKAPEFKKQKNPYWRNAFWIGDALASFYPALGYGFAHSVNSALLAAHFYQNADATRYNQFIKKEINHKLTIGALLHRTYMNPALSNLMLSMIQKTPKLAHLIMKKAGYG